MFPEGTISDSRESEETQREREREEQEVVGGWFAAAKTAGFCSLVVACYLKDLFLLVGCFFSLLVCCLKAIPVSSNRHL